MRYIMLRVVLATMLIVPATVVLSISVSASVPLSVDVSDGYTFSGVQRTQKSGAISEFIENPIGPFAVSGDRGFVQLSWDVAQSLSFLNCDPDQQVVSRSESIQNRQTNHYSVNLSGTTQMIESIIFHVPSYENAGGGTTAPFPLEEVQKSILFLTPNGEVTNPLMSIEPKPGEALAYRATFNPPVEAGQLFNFDLTFQGQAEPPLTGNPQTSPSNCPAPNEDLEESTDFGRTQLFFFDPYVVVNVAEPTPNSAPVFDLQGTTTVEEGGTIEAVLTITDPGGDPINLSLEPGGARCDTFVDDANPSSLVVTFNCPTQPGDAGEYVYEVSASDGTETVSTSVVITVEPVGLNPRLAPVSDVIVDEGATASFEVSAINLDPADTYILTSDLPSFATVGPFENGTTTVMLNPDFDSAAVYTASMTLASGTYQSLDDTAIFTITVNDVNRPPVVDPVDDITMNAGDSSALDINVSDPDGDGISYFWPQIPAFCTLSEAGVQIQCNPNDLDAGTHDATVQATDDGDPPQTVEESFTVTVNRKPVISPVPNQQVIEGEELFGTIDTSDPDGDQVAISGQNLPSFCTLTDNGDNSATFECKPQAGDAGVYTLTIVASDGTAQVMQTVKVTVLKPNNPPTLEPIPDQQVTIGHILSVPLDASDPDGDTVTLIADGLPPGAIVRDFGGGFGFIDLNPERDAEGTYVVTVTATDNGTPNLSGSRTFILTVVSDGGATFDSLAQLTRDVVRPILVERVLLTIVYLADYFDEQGDEGAAERLLRSFIRLVESLPPFVISTSGAEELIEMAEVLLDEYD